MGRQLVKPLLIAMGITVVMWLFVVWLLSFEDWWEDQ